MRQSGFGPHAADPTRSGPQSGARLLWLAAALLLAACESAGPDTGAATVAACVRDDECPKDGTCTTPRCEAGACSLQAVTDGQPCATAGKCSNGQTCAAGACQGGSARVCDDGIDCTADGCDPATGCWFNASASACDDANPCTSDSCAASGCHHKPTLAACDDGDNCTENDTCGAGVCSGSSAGLCDDSNLCTTDSCDADSGCVHVFNQAPCDDGDPQTVQDTCFQGTCDGK